MQPPKKLVGIAGMVRSGKDSLAELFIKAGYFGVSLGDIVRDAARERHKGKPDPISVANMTETANWLRTENGADFALVEAFKRFDKAQAGGQAFQGLLVFSVRVPVEVDFILKHDGDLIWVEASDEVRHDRHDKNRRAGEAAVTMEEFRAQEAKQWQPQPDLPPEVQMNVKYVKEKATKVLENNGNDFDAFIAAGKKLIADL